MGLHARQPMRTCGTDVAPGAGQIPHAVELRLGGTFEGSAL